MVELLQLQPKSLNFMYLHVRISLCKRLFKKGYEMNWTEEIFQITQQLSRTPVVYTVQDLPERPIKGTFYEEE